MAQDLASSFVIPNDVPVCQLDCTSAFHGLEEKEKKYAHYLSKACHEGALICLLQTSPEAPAIFSMFQKLFKGKYSESMKSEGVKGQNNEDIEVANLHFLFLQIIKKDREDTFKMLKDNL